MDHIVLAVSYMSDLLEKEMRIQEQRVITSTYTTLLTLTHPFQQPTPPYYTTILTPHYAITTLLTIHYHTQTTP